MEILAKLKTVTYALMIGVFMFACSQETREETNAEIDEMQTEATDAAVETDREYNDFEVWVNENEAKAETATEQEWAELNAEYDRREAELEARSSTWDEETKREWNELKGRWERTENKVQERLRGVEDVDVDVDVHKDHQ
ncbi:hypothetical protein [Botryobacter ruber]|uniref:hypothetical protein n=1 Tax=Botryobacter ruber TaxID=2171629 RepID=UPI000E0B6C46|nr:hypothetical protein [Botryobacter ruber]